MTAEDGEAHDLPSDWQAEAPPTVDREWLTASYVAVPLGVAVSVLVADPLEAGDEPVYPIAVTVDANEVVYRRQYDICGVVHDLDAAHKKAHTLMTAVSEEFSEGRADFVRRAVTTAFDVDGPMVFTSTSSA
jgi:hypothetical protein